MPLREAPPRGREQERSSTPQGKKQQGPGRAPENDADVEIMEFLEGLLEGFRAAAAANAAQGNTGPRQPKWFEAEGNRGGDWADLNELEKSLPQFSSGVDAYADRVQKSRSASPVLASPSRTGGRAGDGRGGGFASDPLSTMMRRHALRSFLEEMCGSVAKAFEQMATLAVRNSLGSQGGCGLPEQRMKYKFGPGDFQKTLSHMEYGVGAGAEWWNALFKSIDVDEDGAISLQDMYDALVLDLPPLPGPAGGASTTGSVFFSATDGASSASPPQRHAGGYAFSPSSRGGSSLQNTLKLDGLFDDECRVCGSDLSNDMVVCRTCGAKRVQRQ